MFQHGEDVTVDLATPQPHAGAPLHALAHRVYLRHSLGKRLAVLMVVGGTVAVLLTVFGILGLRASNESLHTVYEERMVPVRELAARVHEDGTWQIDGVPEGTHKLTVTEPNGGSTDVTVTACDSDTVNVSVTGKRARKLTHLDGTPYPEYQ